MSCKGLTKNDRQCKRTVKEGEFCYQHKKNNKVDSQIDMYKKELKSLHEKNRKLSALNRMIQEDFEIIKHIDYIKHELSKINQIKHGYKSILTDKIYKDKI